MAALAFAAVYLYRSGRQSGVNEGNKNIAEYQTKIETLNRQLREKEIAVRERVINNYHTRTIERVKVEYVNRDVIRTVVPEQFKLSKGWVHAHDQAAKGEVIDPALAADPKPSDTTDRAALAVVSDNYNLANRNADRLEALQTYLKEMGLTNESPKP
jgi:vacuolar-type H+-ATPase subunit I/STV1